MGCAPLGLLIELCAGKPIQTHSRFSGFKRQAPMSLWGILSI